MTYAGLEPEVAEDELDLVDDEVEDEAEDTAGEDDEDGEE